MSPRVSPIRFALGAILADVRHEESAAFAAGAEAQLTGRLAVCAGSCGPGTFTSSMDCSISPKSGHPFERFAAQIPSPEIIRGRGTSRKRTRTSSSGECSHYAELVSQPEQMPLGILEDRRCVRRSHGRASGRGDSWGRCPSPATSGRSGLTLNDPRPRVCPTDSEVSQMADLLSGPPR